MFPRYAFAVLRFLIRSVSSLAGFSFPARGSSPLHSLPSLPLSHPVRFDLGLCFVFSHVAFLPRKEVIQPHLPIRLPCYDFTPVIGLALGGWLLAVTSPTLGTPNAHGVTGGVYKARERIHRGMLIRDY